MQNGEISCTSSHCSLRHELSPSERFTCEFSKENKQWRGMKRIEGADLRAYPLPSLNPTLHFCSTCFAFHGHWSFVVLNVDKHSSHKDWYFRFLRFPSATEWLLVHSVALGKRAQSQFDAEHLNRKTTPQIGLAPVYQWSVPRCHLLFFLFPSLSRVSRSERGEIASKSRRIAPFTGAFPQLFANHTASVVKQRTIASPFGALSLLLSIPRYLSSSLLDQTPFSFFPFSFCPISFSSSLSLCLTVSSSSPLVFTPFFDNLQPFGYLPCEFHIVY